MPVSADTAAPAIHSCVMGKGRTTSDIFTAVNLPVKFGEWVTLLSKAPFMEGG